MTCAFPYVDLGGSPMNPGFAVRSREEIARRVWDAIDNAAFVLGRKGRNLVHAQEKAAVAELQRRYDAALRAHNARRRAVGLIAREKAAEIAERAASDALLALTKAKPTTREGLTALAHHLASLSPSQAPWWVMQLALKNAAA